MSTRSDEVVTRSPPATSRPTPPRSSFPSLPRYKLLDTLGEGGFATVYLAYDASLDLEVALKVMDPRLARERGFCERFVREAHDTARLGEDAAEIVTVRDAGCVGDLYYIAMQYLPGPNLSALLAEARRSGRTLLETEQRDRHPLQVALRVARALAHAHKQGFVHRDIKPANILFGNDGKAVLSDFGIARALGRLRQTTTGAAPCTPLYMSPDQVQRPDSIDGRSDIYSLGVVLFEMLAGDVPYRAENSTALMYMHVHDAVPSLPPSAARYQSLVARMMAKDPRERHASAEELIKHIEGCIAPPEPPWRARAVAAAAVIAFTLLLAVGYATLAPMLRTADDCVVALDDEERRTLGELLANAALHEDSGYDDLAIETNNLALDIDPCNAVARDALERLVQRSG